MQARAMDIANSSLKAAQERTSLEVAEGGQNRKSPDCQPIGACDRKALLVASSFANLA